MVTYSLNIKATPVPWAAHKGFGKRAYNPRRAEREEVQWLLKDQWKMEPIKEALRLTFFFFLPLPKKERNKYDYMPCHTRKPDCTNLQKFMEDALKGIVFKDDSQVISVESHKYWTDKEEGMTKVIIQRIDE